MECCHYFLLEKGKNTSRIWNPKALNWKWNDSFYRQQDVGSDKSFFQEAEAVGGWVTQPRGASILCSPEGAPATDLPFSQRARPTHVPKNGATGTPRQLPKLGSTLVAKFSEIFLKRFKKLKGVQSEAASPTLPKGGSRHLQSTNGALRPSTHKH